LAERQGAVAAVAEQTCERRFYAGAVEAVAEEAQKCLNIGACRREESVPPGGLAEPLALLRERLRIHGSDGRAAVGQRGRPCQRRGDVLQAVTTQVRSQLGPGRTAYEEGMQRRPAVVMEAGGAQLSCLHPAARLCHLLE